MVRAHLILLLATCSVSSFAPSHHASGLSLSSLLLSSRDPISVSLAQSNPSYTFVSKMDSVRRSKTRVRGIIALVDDPILTSSASSAMVQKKETGHDVPRTWQQALSMFFLSEFHGPRAIVVALVALVVWRSCLSLTTNTFGFIDIGACGSAVLIWWLQEHFLHQHVLHSRVDWYGRDVHAQHHARPYYHVSLDPAWLLCLWAGLFHVLMLLTLPLPSALSATLGYMGAGLWYEWSHFIVHTRVRFRQGGYWQRVRDHHARHHLVSDQHWFAFSLTAVDDIWGTNPSVQQVRKSKKKNG